MKYLAKRVNDIFVILRDNVYIGTLYAKEFHSVDEELMVNINSQLQDTMTLHQKLAIIRQEDEKIFADMKVLALMEMEAENAWLKHSEAGIPEDLGFENMMREWEYYSQ